MDQSVVKAALQGDSAAFTYIYNHTFDKALAIAQGFVKNEHDAFDVVQESYIKLWEKLGTLEAAEKLESWFFTIVKNKSKDFLGSKAHTATVSFSDVESGAEDPEFSFADAIESNYRPFSPEASIDYSETQRLLWGIVNTLPEKQKLCVTLRWKEDMKIQQIADVTGLNVSTVKSCLNYGHKKIGEEVEKLEKKGVKLYGITPLIFLPFLRWLLGGTTAASESAAAAQVTCGIGTATTAASAASAGSSAAGVGKAAKKGAKAVFRRIVAGVCVTAALTTAAVTVPIHDGKTVADYVADGIYAISQIGKPKPGDYVDTYMEKDVDINYVVWSGHYSYRIPQLSFTGPDVNAINQEILNNMLPFAEYIDEAERSGIPPLLVDQVTYDAWLNGEILTLELRLSWSIASDDWDTCWYYCIDTATGQRVSNEQILANTGMADDEFHDLAVQKVSADIRSLLEESAAAINDVCALLGLEEMFTSTDLTELTEFAIPKENLENVVLYYGKRGAVMMLYQIHYGDGISGLYHSVKICD